MRSSRRHLKSITLLMLNVTLCIALLVGSTFAIFTSEDATGISAISANMNMDLLVADADGNYVPVVDGGILQSEIWEPGYTKVVFFKVENNSNINVKYVLRILADLGEMEGSLQYCVFDGSYADLSSMNWEQLSSGKQIRDFENGYNYVSTETFVPLTVNGSSYYTVAINMKTVSGNEYQQKSCEMGIRLYAVQGNAPI